MKKILEDECTRADVLGPSTVENIQHRSMISCDYDRKKWRPVKGYTFLRNKKTNDVIGLRGKKFFLETPIYEFCMTLLD